jgi:hypothetical protein
MGELKRKGTSKNPSTASSYRIDRKNKLDIRHRTVAQIHTEEKKGRLHHTKMVSVAEEAMPDGDEHS